MIARLGCFSWVIAIMFFSWPLNKIGLSVGHSLIGGVALTFMFEWALMAISGRAFVRGAQKSSKQGPK